MSRYKRIGCGKVSILGQGNVFDKAAIRKTGVLLNIVGNGNVVSVAEHVNFARCNIIIYGDNNKIKLGDVRGSVLEIEIGQFPGVTTNGCSINIGDKTAIGGLNIMCLNDNGAIDIGKDCALSCGVNMWLGDGHSIIDMEGKLLNAGGKISVGNHCWLGQYVFFGKRACVADNSVVGAHSVVAKVFDEPNVVIAGNPAKIVKTQINWDGANTNSYKPR